MRHLLILGSLLGSLLAQNTFQNTIFDLPAQLGGEPVGVAAQAQGAPLFVQTADQKAPQGPTPAPFTFPTLPTVAPFTLPSHPTIAPFTLPTHAPFTFPTHPPLVFPAASTPSPFVPPSPYAFVPQGFQPQQPQQQNQFQQYNGYPQNQNQGNQNQYYSNNNNQYNNQYNNNGYNNNNNGYYNQQPQQQQFQGYNNQNQNQNQFVPQQPQPQLPQVQTPTPAQQQSQVRIQPQGPQQVQSFESNSQIVQPVRAVQANAQVVQPVLRPVQPPPQVNAVATAVVIDTDSSAKKATEFNTNIKNSIPEPKPAHLEKANLDAEVDANIDRHLWFAADYDAKQCRQHLNGIGVRFQKKFPSYLQKGGKDRELAELVEQRLLECERKSTASHWDKVDTLLQKINLTKSEEGECRAGLIQERISCVNLLKYACQFVDSSYHFKLVPARITIQEARQAESGADKCRQVIRIVKARLEQNQDGFNALVL